MHGKRVWRNGRRTGFRNQRNFFHEGSNPSARIGGFSLMVKCQFVALCDTGSNPVSSAFLCSGSSEVEQRTENPCVGGSSPLPDKKCKLYVINFYLIVIFFRCVVQ